MKRLQRLIWQIRLRAALARADRALQRGECARWDELVDDLDLRDEVGMLR